MSGPRLCKIRQGDEFQELCDLINEATQPLRESAPSEAPAAAATDATQAPREDREGEAGTMTRIPAPTPVASDAP